jgi:ribosomal RNA-processing protein 1
VGELNWNTEFKMDSRLSEFELSKLWQGIFYCTFLFLLRSTLVQTLETNLNGGRTLFFFLDTGFWMSDKPLVQQALANHLASLLLDVRPKISKKNPSRNGRVGRVKCALAFLKGFWETVTREWAGLDRLR